MFPDPSAPRSAARGARRRDPASSATGSLVRGAAWARWPSRSSKPVRCGNPTLGRFDSGAAPSKGLRDSMRDPRHTRQLGGAHDHPLGSAGNRPTGYSIFPRTFPRAASESAGACVIASASRKLAGGNPINVSVNAIPDGASVGAYFADARGRSFVLAFDTGQPEPSASSCPAPSPDDVCPNIDGRAALH